MENEQIIQRRTYRQQIGIVQFRAIAEKVTRIAKITEKQGSVVSAIRTKNGKNGETIAKRLVSVLDTDNGQTARELAGKLNLTVKQVGANMQYLKSTKRVKKLDNNRWVKI